MSAIHVWYRFATDAAPLKGDDPGSALTRAGLVASESKGSASTGPGIVFFSRVSPELLASVSEASRNGHERVLAVSLSPSDALDAGAWELLRWGASDVLRWDGSGSAAADIHAKFERWAAVDRLVDSSLVQNNLLGSSPAWLAVLRQVVEVARFTDASVLLLGESGTGKELIARLIHSLDARPSKKELIVLDCTTVLPELAGSEFFGHERGAFTGAVATRDGALALSDGGTLFLDEIGDLPLPLQSQLLRAIQERTYKRVGGNRWHSSSFRMICATHRPLADMVEDGRFRADLYYRIGGVFCRIPPLRERPEDILLLFGHFVAKASGSDGAPELDEPVRGLLLGRRYPGNVRELEQLAKRVAARHVGPGPITIGDVPEDERPVAGSRDEVEAERLLTHSIRLALARGIGLKEISRMAGESAIQIALGESSGNLQQAARRLGVTDRALQLRRASRADVRPSGSSGH